MCDTCICLFLCLTYPDINVWSQPCAHRVVLQGAKTQFGFMPVASLFSNFRFWQLQYGSRLRRQVKAWLLRGGHRPSGDFYDFFPLRTEAKIITQTRAQKPFTCQNTMCFVAFALVTNSQSCTSVKMSMCCQVMQVCFHLEPRDQVRMTGPRDDILSSFADLSSLCFGLLSGGMVAHRQACHPHSWTAKQWHVDGSNIFSTCSRQNQSWPLSSIGRIAAHNIVFSKKREKSIECICCRHCLVFLSWQVQLWTAVAWCGVSETLIGFYC